MPIETTNKFLIGASADGAIILKPTMHLTADEAMNLAAWLVAVAEHNASHTFAEVLEAIQNT